MSPETFIGLVRRYCDWAESEAHDRETVHPLLLSLMQGAPGLQTSTGFPPESTFPGLPQEVLWAETKRFADLPLQCYPVVYWPYEVHGEGPFTDDIHEDLGHIYAELQHGLQAAEQGDLTSALRYWRHSYFFHWGITPQPLYGPLNGTTRGLGAASPALRESQVGRHRCHR